MKKNYALLAGLFLLIYFHFSAADLSAQIVSAGDYFSVTKCGPCDNVFSWGYNSGGELGDSTTNEQHSPITVHNLSDVTSVSAGSYFSLALKNNGTVWAWGDNGNGTIGDGTYTDR